jgi:transcriptional regulator with GAF, ATPase, and Fis domain
LGPHSQSARCGSTINTSSATREREVPLKGFAVADLASQFAQAALDARVTGHDSVWIVRTALTVAAIKKAGGNQVKAAEILGLHRNQLARLVKEFRLEELVKIVREAKSKQIELFPRKKAAGSEFRASLRKAG